MIPSSRDPAAQEIKPAILILDDRSSTVQEADSCLKRHGYVCYSSFDTRSAAHLIQNHQDIAILLTAVTSNHRDNFPFVEEIVHQPDNPRDFEVIFFSEKFSEQELLQALRMRAADFLHIPFYPDTLIKSVEKATARIASRIQAKASDDTSHRVIQEMQTLLTNMTERLAKIENQGQAYLHDSSIKQIFPRESSPLHKIAEEKTPPVLSSVDKAHRILAAKKQFFSTKISSDASLIMLLELYKVRQTEKEMPVTALCYSSGIAQTTALRRLEYLEQNGFLKRHHDPADKRRVLIHLTPSGEKEVRRYLEFIERTA